MRDENMTLVVLSAAKHRFLFFSMSQCLRASVVKGFQYYDIRSLVTIRRH